MQFVRSTLCVALLLLVQQVGGDSPPRMLVARPSDTVVHQSLHSDALDCEYFHNCTTPTPSPTPSPSSHSVTPSLMLLPSVMNVSIHLTTTVEQFTGRQPPYPTTWAFTTLSHQPITTLTPASNPATTTLEKDARSMSMVMMFCSVTAGIILIVVGIVICEVYVIYMIRKRKRRKLVRETREMGNSAQKNSDLYNELPLWTSTPVDVEAKKKTLYHGNASLPSPPGTRQEDNRSRPPLHSNPESNGDAEMKVMISVSLMKQKS